MESWYFTEMPYPHLPPLDTSAIMRVARSRTGSTIPVYRRRSLSPLSRRVSGRPMILVQSDGQRAPSDGDLSDMRSAAACDPCAAVEEKRG